MFSTVFILILILIMVAFYTASLEGFATALPNVPSKQNHWWSDMPPIDAPKQSEGFQPESLLPEHNPLLDFIPDGPSPVDLYTKEAYLLLGDEKKAATATGAVVTARGCHDANFENKVSKVGSYRQMTNNYMHAYPDNCSTLNKDLSMNFYSS